MPTPYDNHDGGFTRADRKIAANYGIDLDAPEQVRCDSCNKLFEADELNGAGDCPKCCEMPPGEDDKEGPDPKAVHVSESDRRFEYQELRGSFSNAD